MEQQGDLAYIAMEYVDGPTLDQLLSKREPLPPDACSASCAQTAAALDYAHHKGIVHRDIKPANIMIAADGTAKITDFGIAKITASEQFTMTGSIVGTPHYMSPEQVQGQPVDGRADQFSLAVIAYEMLTGEKPFTGEHLTTVVYKIVAEEPPPLQRLNPTLGRQIDAVLRRGLTKKPEGRYSLCIKFVEPTGCRVREYSGLEESAAGRQPNTPTVMARRPLAPRYTEGARPRRSGRTTPQSLEMGPPVCRGPGGGGRPHRPDRAPVRLGSRGQPGPRNASTRCFESRAPRRSPRSGSQRREEAEPDESGTGDPEPAASNPPETAAAESTGQKQQKPAEAAGTATDEQPARQQPADEEQPEHPELQPAPPRVRKTCW